MRRTTAMLRDDLVKQVCFLENSCLDFDQGDESEALRIAVVIRTLVHDTSTSTSLMNQLNLKDSLQFMDSSSPLDPQPIGDTGRVRISAMPGLIAVSFTRAGAKFVAALLPNVDGERWVSFDEWWNKECIPGDTSARHTRRWLVLKAANTEGGAHIDTTMDIAYQKLNTSSLGMTVTAGGICGFINSSAEVSLRQIAWEMLETIKRLSFESLV